jgi:hypothetical protein
MAMSNSYLLITKSTNMKKNLLVFLMIFAFQLSFFSQLDLHGQDTVFLFTFDETPLTPFELNVNDELGYSINDDFVVNSALSLRGITIPANPVAEGIQVRHWPTQLETDLFYGFSFTGSAASERTAQLFIGTDDRGTAFLDTTITINVTEEDYYFEFLMEGVTTGSALISLELGLSNVSTTLDDFVFERITRWEDSEPDMEDIIWQVRPDKYNLDHSTVEWLRSAGYSVFVDTIDAYFDKELIQPEIDELNAAKLIIISPNANSFDHIAGEVGIGMAQVTTPVLCQSSYVMRGSKMNFFNSETRGSITSGDFIMTGIDPRLMPDGSAIIDTNTIEYIIPKGIENYIKLADTLDNGGVIFAEFEAGTEAYEGGYTPGGNWVYFGPKGQKDGEISLTEEGKNLYLKLLDYLIADDSPDIIWQVRPDKYNLDHSTVEWLRSENYSVFVDTIDAYFDKELIQPEIDELNAAKLIIISTNANSFDYRVDEVGIGMAQVTTPVLCQSSYVMRGSKMNFFNSETRGSIPSGDFIMTGIDTRLMPDGSAIIDTNTIEYIIPVGTGNYNNLADTLDNGGLIFAEFEACVEAYEGGYTPGGHWVFFGPKGQKDGEVSFTEKGKELYMSLIDYLITMPPSDNCSPPPPAVAEIRDTIILSDVTNDPLEPVVLNVKDGYVVDDTYEYVLDGELIIDPLTIPASPQNSGIQVMYGPISVKPNRVYNLSFKAAADNLRNARIILGTVENPGLILDVPFVMLNSPQKYEFEFAAEDNFVTDSAYFYLELGASNISVRIDSIGMTEGFPDVEEESFLFEAEDFADQSLFPPFEVYEDAAACGGKYVMTLQGGDQSVPSDSGRISMEFEVKKRAAFVIWWRVIAPSITDDSFWWDMDGFVGRNNLIEASTEWIWDQVKQEEGTDIDPYIFDLRPGKHTFTIIRRESKTQIDQIYITNQLAVVPEGCMEIDTSGNGDTTSIQNNLELREQVLKVYPNPARDHVTIQTNDERPGVLRIYNITGTMVMTREMETMVTTMDISSLKKGLYIFEYASETMVSRQRAIIQ